MDEVVVPFPVGGVHETYVLDQDFLTGVELWSRIIHIRRFVLGVRFSRSVESLRPSFLIAQSISDEEIVSILMLSSEPLWKDNEVLYYVLTSEALKRFFPDVVVPIQFQQ